MSESAQPLLTLECLNQTQRLVWKFPNFLELQLFGECRCLGMEAPAVGERLQAGVHVWLPTDSHGYLLHALRFENRCRLAGDDMLATWGREVRDMAWDAPKVDDGRWRRSNLIGGSGQTWAAAIEEAIRIANGQLAALSGLLEARRLAFNSEGLEHYLLNGLREAAGH